MPQTPAPDAIDETEVSESRRKWNVMVDAAYVLRPEEKALIRELPDDFIAQVILCDTAHRFLTRLPEFAKQFPSIIVQEGKVFTAQDLKSLTQECLFILAMLNGESSHSHVTEVRGAVNHSLDSE